MIVGAHARQRRLSRRSFLTTADRAGGNGSQYDDDKIVHATVHRVFLNIRGAVAGLLTEPPGRPKTPGSRETFGRRSRRSSETRAARSAGPIYRSTRYIHSAQAQPPYRSRTPCATTLAPTGRDHQIIVVCRLALVTCRRGGTCFPSGGFIFLWAGQHFGCKKTTTSVL